MKLNQGISWNKMVDFPHSEVGMSELVLSEEALYAANYFMDGVSTEKSVFSVTNRAESE